MGAGAATVVALTKRQSKAESWPSSLYLPECRALKSDTPSTLKDDGLAVYHELLVAILQGHLDDPWIPTGPVVAALGDRRTRSPSRSRCWAWCEDRKLLAKCESVRNGPAESVL